MSDTKEKKPEEEPLKDETKEKDVVEKKGIFERLRYIKSNITVEPILAGLIIPSMLAKLAVQNLNLDKACRVKKDFGDEICDALLERKGNSSYEAEVQMIISSIESWKSIIQTAVPTILVIFMGAWSDRTGNRKIPILLPIFGEFMVCVTNILSTYFFYEISIEVTMFLEAAFPAITGGFVMVFLGVFSYISDITDEESRTFRVGLVNLCLTGGIPIGTALSGILLKMLGYYGVFMISGSIYLMTFCYGFFCLKSNTKPNNDLTEKVSTNNRNSIVIITISNHFFTDFISTLVSKAQFGYLHFMITRYYVKGLTTLHSDASRLTVAVIELFRLQISDIFLHPWLPDVLLTTAMQTRIRDR